MVVAGTAHAQVRVGVGVGVGPEYVGPAPACAYGYYGYAPYACAPYGYYGPDYFVGGAFIGRGSMVPRVLRRTWILRSWAGVLADAAAMDGAVGTDGFVLRDSARRW